MLNKSIKFLIENKLVAVILLVLFVGWGIVNTPFNWDIGFLPRNPVAVDAIPDIGENQQIVFTTWDGRSPQDIEDQNHLSINNVLTGYSRSENHSQLVALWFFKYLYHF